MDFMSYLGPDLTKSSRSGPAPGGDENHVEESTGGRG